MSDAATNAAAENLAAMRSLAEEGRDAPLINGVMYVLWGGLIGSAALLVYANAMEWINLGPWAGLWPWMVALGAGWGLSFILGPKSARKPGAATLGNRVAMAVWFAVGIFLTGFWLTLMVVHDNFTAHGVPPYFLFNLMFPLAFGLYGVAFFATATAGRIPWLRWIAFVAWGCAAASLFLLNSVHQLLVGAFGSFACAVLPGLILLRGESPDNS